MTDAPVNPLAPPNDPALDALYEIVGPAVSDRWPNLAPFGHDAVGRVVAAIHAAGYRPTVRREARVVIELSDATIAATAALVRAILDRTPEGFTNAAWHVEAIADTGDGYSTHARQYVIRCLWCAEVFIAARAKDAKAEYDRHIDAMYEQAEREHKAEAAKTGGPA